MKKIILRNSIIISFVLFLFLMFSNISYADYGVPEIIEYDATIIAEDGVEVEDSLSGNQIVKIPYGDKVHVLYETEGKAFAEYNGKTISINLEDIKPASEDVDISKAKGGQKNMYVYREGAFLYKGPSITYGKLDENIEIPVGTIVKIEASTETWGYVEYNGYKGWVYIYTSDYVSPYNMVCSLTEIAYKETSHYITINEIELTDGPGSSNVVGTIPAGEKIDFYLYSNYPDPHGECDYVVYKDLKGWFQCNEQDVYKDYSEQDLSIFAISDCEIYEDTSYNKKIGTIPAYSEFKLIYETVDEIEPKVFIEYNGVRGWLKHNISGSNENRFISEVPNIYKSTLIPNKSINIIDINTKENTGKSLEATKEYYEIYNYYDFDNKTTYIYVEDTENKENTGWIISNSSDYSSRYNYSDADYEFYLNNYVDLSSVLEVNDDTQSTDIAKEKEESKESDKRNIDSILENKLLLCVILAVIIFVVAIIIIVLVNKNEKNKVNKEETSKE